MNGAVGGLGLEFEFRELVSYPVERVYLALRDRMVELPEYLPQITSIEELSRETRDDGDLDIVNLWQGNSKSAPAGVRPFVSKKMLAWRDYGTWREQKKYVEWRFETMHFDSLYECGGVNYLEDRDGSTQLRLTGTLTVHPDRVPGVPRLLAKRLAPKVEQWLINMVTPNLQHLPRAVQAFLDADSANGPAT